jgi:hypothetical protein
MRHFKKLFSSTWQELRDDISGCKGVRFPGVYLLAYSKRDLVGKKISLEDVFYIGMSNSIGGVEQRIYQFLSAIEGNRRHSGGNRFFSDYCGEKPFSKRRNRKKFYFAYVTIPCEVRKKYRKGKDLRKMGEVARLEYYALAFVNDSTRSEPELNKK